MNEVANLKFGWAEYFVLGFADQQAGQFQDVLMNRFLDACG
jgi:hypothetical protein